VNHKLVSLGRLYQNGKYVLSSHAFGIPFYIYGLKLNHKFLSLLDIRSTWPNLFDNIRIINPIDFYFLFFV
jgi:hypothetical protein